MQVKLQISQYRYVHVPEMSSSITQVLYTCLFVLSIPCNWTQWGSDITADTKIKAAHLLFLDMLVDLTEGISSTHQTHLETKMFIWELVSKLIYIFSSMYTHAQILL